MTTPSPCDTTDYMQAYVEGPAKLATFPSNALIDTRERWRRAFVCADLRAIERAIGTRIDEEGCGAAFAGAFLVPGEWLDPSPSFQTTCRPEASRVPHQHS